MSHQPDRLAGYDTRDEYPYYIVWKLLSAFPWGEIFVSALWVWPGFGPDRGMLPALLLYSCWGRSDTILGTIRRLWLHLYARATGYVSERRYTHLRRNQGLSQYLTFQRSDILSSLLLARLWLNHLSFIGTQAANLHLRNNFLLASDR